MENITVLGGDKILLKYETAIFLKNLYIKMQELCSKYEAPRRYWMGNPSERGHYGTAPYDKEPPGPQ
jgi:hypothetical protein